MAFGQSPTVRLTKRRSHRLGLPGYPTGLLAEQRLSFHSMSHRGILKTGASHGGNDDTRRGACPHWGPRYSAVWGGPVTVGGSVCRVRSGGGIGQSLCRALEVSRGTPVRLLARHVARQQSLPPGGRHVDGSRSSRRQALRDPGRQGHPRVLGGHGPERTSQRIQSPLLRSSCREMDARAQLAPTQSTEFLPPGRTVSARPWRVLSHPHGHHGSRNTVAVHLCRHHADLAALGCCIFRG